MNRKILVVDDEAALRVLLCDNLEIDDFVPIPAANGEQALKLALAERPAAAVIDLGLPDMSGWDVCRRLQAAPETAGTALVILSGSTGPDVTAAAAAHGVKHCVPKPYECDDIVELLNGILAQDQGQERS